MSIPDKVKKGFARAHAKVGSGSPVYLRSKTIVDNGPYEADDVTYSDVLLPNVIFLDFSKSFEENVQVGDRFCFVDADTTVVSGDLMTEGDVNYNVIDAITIAPTGNTLMQELHLRQQ